jgi:hypothetical protein
MGAFSPAPETQWERGERQRIDGSWIDGRGGISNVVTAQ